MATVVVVVVDDTKIFSQIFKKKKPFKLRIATTTETKKKQY